MTRSPPASSMMPVHTRVLSRTFLLALWGSLASQSVMVRGLAVWTEGALQQARALSISQREKLLSEPGVVQHRPVLIQAQRLDANSGADEWMVGDSTDNDGNKMVSKIVHFQRHGQGYHNLFGDILRDAGVTPDVDSLDPAVNPWLRPEIVDSPLTERGKEQCQQQQHVASLLNPQLVVVSPLLRAIQTAQISFASFYQDPNVPWVAHEGCREELGVLVCNKRRRLSEIQKDFPTLSFWKAKGNDESKNSNDGDNDEDMLWNPTERESNQSKSDRIYDFLVGFLAERPESEMAVVGHSAWLFHMCNAVVDCGDDEDLATWFLTSEIRSMKLTFYYNQIDES